MTDRPEAAGPVDRLDQFRMLARERSFGNGAADTSPDAYREMYALLDEEIRSRKDAITKDLPAQSREVW